MFKKIILSIIIGVVVLVIVFKLLPSTTKHKLLNAQRQAGCKLSGGEWGVTISSCDGVCDCEVGFDVVGEGCHCGGGKCFNGIGCITEK